MSILHSYVQNMLYVSVDYFITLYIKPIQFMLKNNKDLGKNSYYWAERSACDQRSNLGRPLFLVLPSSAQAPAQLSWAELALILFPPAPSL